MDIERTSFAAFLTFFLSGPALGQSVDLTPFLEGENLSASLDLNRIDSVQGRCHLDVALITPRLWSDLDAKIRAHGNLGSSRNRLFWVGPTRLRGVEGGNQIGLTSRARYESWAIFKVLGREMKNKNFQDTKTVEFLLRPSWDSANDRLSLAYEIQNIRNVPGGLEAQLRKLGVDFGGETSFRVPREDQAMQTLDPRIEKPLVFKAEGADGLRITTTVSVDLPPIELFFGLEFNSCTTLKGIIETAPNEAQAFIAALIRKL